MNMTILKINHQEYLLMMIDEILYCTLMFDRLASPWPIRYGASRGPSPCSCSPAWSAVFRRAARESLTRLWATRFLANFAPKAMCVFSLSVQNWDFELLGTIVLNMVTKSLEFDVKNVVISNDIIDWNYILVYIRMRTYFDTWWQPN